MTLIYGRHCGDLVTVDFYGPLFRSGRGEEYIIENFILQKEPIPKPSQRKYSTVISLEWKPSRILADHETQLMSSIWNDELRKFDIEAIFSSIKNPQNNTTEHILKQLGRNGVMRYPSVLSLSHRIWTELSEGTNRQVHRPSSSAGLMK